MPRSFQIKTQQEKMNLLAFLIEGTYPEGLDKDQKRNFRAKAANFTAINGIIFHKGKDNVKRQLVCEFENDLIENILSIEHSVAHIGVKKLLSL